MKIILFLMLALAADISSAADGSVATLVIRNKAFEPKTLSLPSGVKMKVVLRNEDALPAEFESYDLSREIVVPAHGEVSFSVGPLKAGSYGFFNDFDHDMQGSVEAKPSVDRRG